MNKRRMTSLGAVAVAATCALALAGCAGGTGTPTPSGSSTLTLGTDIPERVELLVSEFEKANPGVKVEVVSSGGSDYEEFMRTRLAGGTAPDVIRVFPGAGGNSMTVGTLVAAGAIADLSGESWVGELSESQKLLFSGSDGKVAAVPDGATALAPVWNDQALEAIGAAIPETYDELLALCATAKENGKVAMSLGQKDIFVAQLTPYTLAANLVNGPDPLFPQDMLEGKATFADSDWEEVFAKNLEMLDAGCFNEGPNGTSYDESMKLMGSGQALGQVTFADLTVQQEAAPEGTTFTMTPFPSDGGQAYMAIADSYGFAVNSKAKDADLAKKFIEFAASAEGQNAFATSFGGVPSIPNDSFEPQSDIQQTVVDWIASGNTAIWPDQMWPSPDISSTLMTGVQNMFNGSDTPAGIVQKMDEAFAAAIE